MLYDIISKNIPDNYIRYADFDSKEAESVVDAIERNWIQNGKGVSVPFWSDEIGDTKLNKIIYMLSQAGWIHSKILPRYGSFKLKEEKLSSYIDLDKMSKHRIKSRVHDYKLRCVEDERESNMIKTPSGRKETGIDRKGFAQSAQMNFSFDTAMMLKYYDPILLNCIKSMAKMSKRYPHIKDDEANYGDISSQLMEYYICNPNKKYNLESNSGDQRGRAIPQGLRRVFNPIQNKDARALLIVDKPVFVMRDNAAQMNDIYLFIAELAGTKAKSWQGKKLSGMNSYNNRRLHKLDLNDEKDRKDLHENIWLERIYDKLDILNQDGSVMWDIPLEMDATASIAQIIGVLMNEERLLNKTNVINSSDVQDFWNIDGVSNRKGIKAIGTPVGYGSSQSFKKLLDSKKEILTKEEMKLVRKEFRDGAFSIIKGFKDFILGNCNIQTRTTEITTWNETFTIEVNKFKAVGADLKAYTGFDTDTNRDRVFLIHKPTMIPDYDRFKLFTVTGLIHNLDSILMDGTMMDCYANNEWAIAIHDAGLVLPGTVMRKAYLGRMNQMREDRHEIMSNYRESIGAVGEKADIQWAKLCNTVHQLDESVPFEESALK